MKHIQLSCIYPFTDHGNSQLFYLVNCSILTAWYRLYEMPMLRTWVGLFITSHPEAQDKRCSSGWFSHFTQLQTYLLHMVVSCRSDEYSGSHTWLCCCLHSRLRATYDTQLDSRLPPLSSSRLLQLDCVFVIWIRKSNCIKCLDHGIKA